MTDVVFHASCVAIAGPQEAQDAQQGLRGVLIKGASGSGKSSLALELMSRGGLLVADDRVEISRRDGALWARSPAGIAGLIEARGLGILRAEYVAEVQLHVVVDMNRLETARLPGHLVEHVMGIALPRVNRVDGAFFAAALVQYVKGGALNPDDGLSTL